MKRGFNACQTHRSMYPSIFNCFPVIQAVSSKVHHFSTFLHILAYPGYAPGTIAVNVTWLERGLMLVKRIAAYTHLSSTVYELLVENWNWNFFPTLAFNAPVGGVLINSGKKFGSQKTRITGQCYRQWRQFDDRLSHFDTIPACDGRTEDRRTDRRPAYINNVRSNTDAR